jgi:hypothetical protein
MTRGSTGGPCHAAATFVRPAVYDTALNSGLMKAKVANRKLMAVPPFFPEPHLFAAFSRPCAPFPDVEAPPFPIQATAWL